MNRIRQFFGNLTPDAWVRIGLWTIFSLIVVSGIHSCASGDDGKVDNGIWVLLGGGLIVAAVMTRERSRLPYVFAGMGAFILLILLGVIETLFSWAVIGLPLLAAGGIYGWLQVSPGRTRSFLGFSIGIVISIWLFLLIQAKIHPDMTFLGKDRLKEAGLIILLLSAGLFVFATWKRSKIFYLLSFLVLMAWLGSAVFNKIFGDFPTQFKKPFTALTDSKLVAATGKLVDAFTTKVSAKADKEAVAARKEAQVQKTWVIQPGVVVYNCSTGSKCTETGMEFKIPVEILSLGEAVEVYGMTYEKVLLPDPNTGKPGEWTGWIRSMDLTEKSGRTGSEKAGHLIEVVHCVKPPYPTQFADFLPPGKYSAIFNPAAASGGEVQVLLSNGKAENRKLSDGCFQIADGEKGTAIGNGLVSIAKIYAD